MKSLRISLAALVCTFATQMPLSAAQILLTQNVNGSGTASVSNLSPVVFISDAITFNQFDPALGTLTSAMLNWDFDSAAIVTPPAPVPNGSPNPFTSGDVAFVFRSSSVSGSFSNATTVEHFSFAGPDGSASLALGPLIGNGTFTAGTIQAILDLASPTLFPVGVSGDYRGSANLTYVYEPIRGQDAPEPATLLLLASGLTAATAAPRRRRGRSSTARGTAASPTQ